MSKKHLSSMEMEVMQQFWKLGDVVILDIKDSLPITRQVKYTTVQTIVYRLEKKGAVKRTRKIGNAHVFRAVWTKKSAIGSLIEEFLAFFGGSEEPVMSYLVDSGKLNLEAIKVLENAVKERNQNGCNE